MFARSTRRKTAILVAFFAVRLAPSVSFSTAKAISETKSSWQPKLLYSEDFRHGLADWVIEAEKPGRITASDGYLEIDVPAGLTLWFKKELRSPVAIEYEATVISSGGTNDRVSDLNCFWMATDPHPPEDPIAHRRSGKFADYNTLLTYYVGLGGNGNTTTRFRRYVGDAVERPLRSEDDHTSPEEMIEANKPQKIRLIAAGRTIEFYRDDRRLFHFGDSQPYTHGWFAFRTTKNHMTVRGFRVYRLHATTRW